jgi:alpha-glucosidase
MHNALSWWQKAVFYQIYPRSFADGNNDGIGDFQGIIQKLDYLKSLGIDALWLSPHYPSPLVDCGYDVTDYCGIAPEYGSMDLFDSFLEAAHQREIRVVLDLVLNHTSDQHPWFIESRSNRTNPKRDWYVWKDGTPDHKPNNWYSIFGGPAWTFDHAAQSWYYHFFFKEQPDLNWENPEVKEAVFNVVRFWLDKGVDGFRLDAVNSIFENDPRLMQEAGLTQKDLFRLERKAESEDDKAKCARLWRAMYQHQLEQPRLHALMKELRQVVDEYDDRVLIGETENIAFYGEGDDELHLVFNFPLMNVEQITPAHVRANQAERLADLPDNAWPCNTLGNHDSSRMRSHFGNGENSLPVARLNMMLLMTLKGTPFLYNGEEIGMTDYWGIELDQFEDPCGTWRYQLERDVIQASHQAALVKAVEQGRDKCRTPMQWANQPNAGFCGPEISPWLPVNPDYTLGINVRDQEADPSSMLNFIRHVIQLRKSSPALLHGEFHLLPGHSKQVLSYSRHFGKETLLILLNMSDQPQSVALNQFTSCEKFGLLLSTHFDRANEEASTFNLSSYEGMILKKI